MILDLVLPVAMLFALASGYNYCENKTHYCNQFGWKHFTCRVSEELPAFGGTRFEELVPDTLHFQKDVLHVINDYRNQVASGKVLNVLNRTYPSAMRMRPLIWDQELAYLSRVHASTVSFKHTECRSTLRFPEVGEIVEMMAAPLDTKLTVLQVLRALFSSIWKEHYQIQDPVAFTSSFDATNDTTVGDFALMINDRVSRVGCSIALGSNCPYRDTGHCIFMTCYFDYNNVENGYIYKYGAPTSGCNEWKATIDEERENLCNNKGEIFQN